jgi:hypothetical protein
MGLWSSIKKAAKKVWRAVKSVARVIVRIVITIINRLTLGLPDLLLGFLAWPPKRLRLHVVIVSVKSSNPDGGESLVPVVPEHDVEVVIENTKRIYKKLFNVNIRSYSKSFIEILPEEPPKEVLDFTCGIQSEFGIAGEYFANHLAGWNAIPISLTFPITVFVVRELLEGPSGCSMAVLGEYVVIDEQGLKEDKMIALPHEIGHTCGLWHSGTAANLMHNGPPADENVKWFQKNILRSSRHVQWW